jgi:LysM repeat protein
MKNLIVAASTCALLLGGCSSTLTALRGDQDHVFDEFRTEIADLKHALHTTEVELKLLEDRFDNQEPPQKGVSGDVASLQKKISSLEKSVDKINVDLKSLMTYANQTTTSLTQYKSQIQEIDKKLEEIGKLRSTLSQISKGYSASAETPSQTYRVKSGDSLEKIARKFQVSVESLKENNDLKSDKIVIGQELVITR